MKKNISTVELDGQIYSVVSCIGVPTQKNWQLLEEVSNRSFFLSWPWIDTWSTTHANKAVTLYVYTKENGLIGAGVFHESKRTRFGIIIRQLYLHQTGCANQDVVCLEYNDILADKVYQNTIRRIMLAYLTQNSNIKFDEIILSGLTGEIANEWQQVAYECSSNYTTHTVASAQSAYVDIAALHKSNNLASTDLREKYLTSLGKSTRASIRRSIRLYEKKGKLELHVAQSPEQAWQFLSNAQLYHRKRWGKAAFDYKAYKEFHQYLIRKNFDKGCIDAVYVTCGQEPVGWLYNFIDCGQVYYYFGAFNFDDSKIDSKFKPGLVTHTLAVERYLGMGLSVYDFMGGNLAYKFNLGQQGVDIVTIALQRVKSIPIRIERSARYMKQKLRAK